MERLQKVIAQSGLASRRKAEELIKQGKVKVDGQVVTELGTKVASNAAIEVAGKKLLTEEKEYYLLNKPRGTISSVSDEHDRDTVVSLINTTTRIYPVGRLDYDTTGILILTNDGNLTNILTHPKFNVEKTYIAKIEGFLSSEEMNKLKRGIAIDGIKVLPTKIKSRKRDYDKKTEIIELTIVEGRNHIVKRLFSELNHEVVKLKRESYSFLTLGNLKSGEYRELTLKEVKKLYNLINNK